MTTRKWTTLNPGKFVPKSVTDAVGFIEDDVVAPYAELLTTLKDIISLTRLALLAGSDPVLAAIDAALIGAQQLLDVLLDRFGIHVLFVPVIRTGKEIPELEISTEDLDGKDIPLVMGGPPVGEGSGGNWGFFATFANSIEDEDDLNRPKYPDTFAVLSMTIITGASNVGDLLKQLYYLAKLLSQLVAVPLDGNLLPVPQNLRLVTTGPIVDIVENVSAYLVGEDPGNNVFAVLRWDTPDVFTPDVFLNRVQVDVISTSVYLKIGEPFGVVDVGDVLAGYEIRKIEDPFLRTRISIGELDPREDYYVAAGFNILLTETYTNEDGEDEDIVTEMEHYDVGNQIRINLSERQPPLSNLGQSTPPDWVSLTSPLDLIPGVATALKLLIAYLQTLRDQIASPIDELDEFLEDVEDYVTFLATKLGEISQTLLLINTILKSLRVGFSVYGMYADRGGSDLVVSEMNKAFFDPATEDTPPFESGGDIVSGVVLMAAAPGPAAIAPLLELYRLLFGDVFRKIEGEEVLLAPEDPDTGLVGTEIADTFEEAVNSIMRVTEEVERSTDAILEATELIPLGEEYDEPVDTIEVDAPCS